MKSYISFILFAFVVVLVAFAHAAPEGRVTGGSNAARNQFPYQVSFQWGLIGIWQHVCGGVILTPNRIITAGHCITESPGIGSFRIIAGILLLNENIAARQISAVGSNVVHPNYAGGVNPNDLAILRLSTTLSWSAAVQPINLPSAGAIPGGTGTLSGWGSTSTTNTPIMPNTLQQVTKPILTIAACRNALIALMGSAGPLADSNVCTGPLTGGVSACSGDSGGPLAQGNTVVGIVSWGVMPCGTTGAPSVYVRVSAFNAWINSLL